MKAWWSYWLTLVVGAVLWIGIALVAGGFRQFRRATETPLKPVLEARP